MTKLGRFIVRTLKEKNIKTSEFLELSKISRSYYYKIRKDDNVSITITVAEAIAFALNIDLKLLLEEMGKISILNNYVLTEEQAINFVKINDSYLRMCGLDYSKMNNTEIKEFAEYIFSNFHMASFKYK